MSPNDPTIRRMTTHVKSTLDRAFHDFGTDYGALDMLDFTSAMKDANKVVFALSLHSKAYYEAAKKVIGEIR